MSKTTYMVAVEVEPLDGSPMAAAVHQGWGASYLRGYLESKMPAGSPVTIGTVARVDMAETSVGPSRAA